MVQHLNEDPSGSAPQFLDSTSNNNDMTAVGSMTAGDSVAAQIDKGVDLDGVDDDPQAPDDASLKGLTNITLELWLKTTFDGTGAGGTKTLLSKTGLPSQFSYGLTEFGVTGPDSSKAAMVLFQSGGSAHLLIKSTTKIDDGKFHYIVGTGIENTNVKIYMDGILEGTSTSTTGTYHKNGTAPTRLSFDGDTVANIFVPGVYDEARISSVVRSADWIKAQSLSMTDKYVTYGPEENLNGFIRQTIEFDENSRRSAPQFFLRVTPPKPDGTISGRDRRHVQWLYSSSGDTTDFSGKIIEKV